MEAAPMQLSQATSSRERRLVAPLSPVARSVQRVPCATVDQDVEPAVAVEANGTQVAAAECGIGTTETTVAGPWSDLPGDLLGAVCTMVPTVLDRVRLAAVCGPWRAALTSRRRRPAPPALPWLLFLPWRDDRVGKERLLYSPEDGGPVMRVSLPSLQGSRLLGSHDGGWVAAFHEGRRRIEIVNLFSGVVVPLSGKQQMLQEVLRGTNHWSPIHVRKLVFSEAPTSSGCILAAITQEWNVVLCRIGCANRGWNMASCREFERVLDIAFCDGVLYGLKNGGGGEGLVRYEISVDDADGPPVVTTARRMYVRRHDGFRSRVDDPQPQAYISYIFELNNKPAMAVRARWSPDHEPSFRVFELVSPDDYHVYDYEWAEVTSLGDYALFVGTAAPCRMVHIPTGRRGGVEANRVYYYNHEFLFSDDPLDGGAVCMDASGGRALYSGDDSVDGYAAKRRIVSVGYYVVDPRTTTWLLPPDL